MPRFTWVAVFALSTLGGPAGCDGDDGDGNGDVTCMAFSACGGDVKGDWMIASWCNLDLGFDGCPEAEILSFPQPTGTVSFKSDGTYATSLTIPSGSIRIKLPLSCLAGATSCEQVNQPGEFTCTGNAMDGCTCDQVVNGNTETTSGTYTTSGTTLTVTGSDPGSTPTVLDYCVSGSTLRVRDMDDGMIMVLTK